MKQIIKIVIGFFFMSFIFSSCTKKETNTNLAKKITANNMQFVGIEHNEMLSEVYNFLAKEKTKFKQKSDKTFKLDLENFLITRIKANKKYSEKSNNIGALFIKKEFNKLKFAEKTTNEDVVLSKKEKNYLENLNQILSSAQFNNANVTENIIKLEIVIQLDKDLTDQQLITLLSATSTAKYSYKYWSENIEKWEALSNRKGKSEQTTEAGPGKIVKADVAGAVGGAVTAWAINVIPVEGQVAYAGAIIGGAVGGSAYEAASEFLDWLF